jgi:hypothetical protein
MARITKFVEKNLTRNSLHDPIDASFTIFEYDNRTFLQIDSYGRETREVPGKKSQTIQFDHDAAAQLFAILRDAFRFD